MASKLYMVHSHGEFFKPYPCENPVFGEYGLFLRYKNNKI